MRVSCLRNSFAPGDGDPGTASGAAEDAEGRRRGDDGNAILKHHVAFAIDDLCPGTIPCMGESVPETAILV